MPRQATRTERQAALDEVVALLDRADGTTTNTSMRLPETLRRAAAIAVDHLDAAPSTTSMTADALRAALEGAVVRAALDLEYERWPQHRPTLGEVALALAGIEGSPLADHPDLVTRAAEEVLSRHRDATPSDVLLWAEARNLNTVDLVA